MCCIFNNFVSTIRVPHDLVENKHKIYILKPLHKVSFKSLTICAECIDFSYVLHLLSFFLSSHCFCERVILLSVHDIFSNFYFFVTCNIKGWTRTIFCPARITGISARKFDWLTRNLNATCSSYFIYSANHCISYQQN